MKEKSRHAPCIKYHAQHTQPITTPNFLKASAQFPYLAAHH